MNEQVKKQIGMFVLGLVLGTCAVFGSSRMRHHHHKPNPERLAERFTRELDLRDDQRKAVRAALESSAVKLHDLHAETFDKFKKIRGETHADIRRLLDAEQQRKFDAMAARWDARQVHESKIQEDL